MRQISIIFVILHWAYWKSFFSKCMNQCSMQERALPPSSDLYIYEQVFWSLGLKFTPFLNVCSMYLHVCNVCSMHGCTQQYVTMHGTKKYVERLYVVQTLQGRETNLRSENATRASLKSLYHAPSPIRAFLNTDLFMLSSSGLSLVYIEIQSRELNWKNNDSIPIQNLFMRAKKSFIFSLYW